MTSHNCQIQDNATACNDVTPPSPQEVHDILNRDYSISRPSPLTVIMQAPGPPPSVISIQTSGSLILPESRLQMNLPAEMLSEILSQVCKNELEQADEKKQLSALEHGGTPSGSRGPTRM